MPTELDLELVPETAELIGEFGLDVTFVVKTPQVYVPATGTVTDGASTTYTIKATPPDPDVYKYLPKDIVKGGDVVIFIAGQGLAFTPQPPSGDADITVTIQGDSYRIVEAHNIRSGEQTAAWMLQLRR